MEEFHGDETCIRRIIPTTASRDALPIMDAVDNYDSYDFEMETIADITSSPPPLYRNVMYTPPPSYKQLFPGISRALTQDNNNMIGAEVVNRGTFYKKYCIVLTTTIVIVIGWIIYLLILLHKKRVTF